MMKHAQHSVSDGSPEGVKTGTDLIEDDSAVPAGQTPFPTSPLNEGARTPDTKPVAYLIKHPDYDNGLDFGELTEADRRAGYSSEPLYPASAVTTLLTNLAEAQRERRQALDLAERHMNEKHKIQAQAKEDWDLLQSLLSHLQTRLEEVERVLPRLDEGLIEAAYRAHYGQNGNPIGTDLTVDGKNWTFAEGFRRMWNGVRKELRRRAALQPKGESRE